MTCNLTTPAPDEAPASLMALPDELLRKIASFSQLFASAPALVVAIGRHGGAAVKEEHRNMARKSAAKLFPRGVVASLEQAKRDVARCVQINHGRAARNRHRHAIEQASRRWRGGRRDDAARTRRKILISTQVARDAASWHVFDTVEHTRAPNVVEKVRTLLALGADPEAYVNPSALHYAPVLARHGVYGAAPRVTHLLLAGGADPHSKTSGAGLTPLCWLFHTLLIVVDEAERTDKLDARAARDLLRTFDVFVPRSAFAPADDDAARAAAAARIAKLNEEGRLFAGRAARGDSFREVVSRFERVLAQSREPYGSAAEEDAEQEAARRARDLGKALAATMPAVSLPPPLEKPRRRRDAGAQSPPAAAPAIALPPDAAAPMPVLEDQAAAPLALFQVHQNLFDATAIRRRSATARRRRRLLLDSDSSDDDDPFRHRRRTPSQEAIDAADVAAEEAEGRRFRAMARRRQNSHLHTIDLPAFPRPRPQRDAAVQAEVHDEHLFLDEPPPLIDHVTDDGAAAAVANEPVVWPPAATIDISSDDDDDDMPAFLDA